MVPSLTQWLSIACLLPTAFSYVDFGTITQPVAFEPTFTVPRPHQLPDDVWMRYAPFQSHIRAVAPSVRQLGNGSFATSWSMHFHFEPTRTIAHSGLRRRGVLAPRGVLPPIPTCRQCDLSGNPLPGSNSTDAGSPTCTVTDYEVRSHEFFIRRSILTDSSGRLPLRRLPSNPRSSRLLLQCRLYRSPNPQCPAYRRRSPLLSQMFPTRREHHRHHHIRRAQYNSRSRRCYQWRTATWRVPPNRHNHRHRNRDNHEYKNNTKY